MGKKSERREQRVAAAIERNKREEEEKELQRELELTREREIKRLNFDRERCIYDYLVENALTMELRKAYILDAIGEEVVVCRGYDNDDKKFHVTFGEGREKIIYSIEKDEEGDVIIQEIKEARKSRQTMRSNLLTASLMAGLLGGSNSF